MGDGFYLYLYLYRYLYLYLRKNPHQATPGKGYRRAAWQKIRPLIRAAGWIPSSLCCGPGGCEINLV